MSAPPPKAPRIYVYVASLSYVYDARPGKLIVASQEHLSALFGSTNPGCVLGGNVIEGQKDIGWTKEPLGKRGLG